MKSYTLVVFLVACLSIQEATSRPDMQDKAQEIFDRVKERAQEAVEHAQEAASRAVESAKAAVQEAMQAAQQAAQQGIETGREWIEGVSTTLSTNQTAIDGVEKQDH